MKGANVLKKVKRIKPLNILMLTFAGIVNAIGVTMFLAPVSIYDSGISGTSMLLDQITPEVLPLGLFLLLLNVPLFLYGMKRQGYLFTFYAIFTVIIYSLSAFLIVDVLPIDVATSSPFANGDLFLCSIFGGIISGIGSGLAIRFGGAMDGVEVMAVIFSKRLGITVGTFVMIYNILLYVCCGVFTKSWILPLYSIVTYTAGLKTIDFIVEGFDRAKCAMIITTKPDEICKELTEAFETGVTKIEVTGGYSGENKTMVYFIINRFQVVKLRETVHNIDRFAYITISEVADVFKNNQDIKR